MLAASVLLSLGFRWPLMVLPGLESQILLKSDLRPSPIAFRCLEGPRLSPQDVLCLSQDADRQSGKPSQRFPSISLGAAVSDDEMGGGKDSSESSSVPPGQWLLGTQREVLSAWGHCGEQGQPLMRFLCVLLFWNFYEGVSSQRGVTTKEILAFLSHPSPNPVSEEDWVLPAPDSSRGIIKLSNED